MEVAQNFYELIETTCRDLYIQSLKEIPPDVVDAIKRAGTTDGPKLRDAIAATRDFQAVTGKITINENRDATKSAVILKVEDGKFKYLETVEP